MCRSSLKWKATSQFDTLPSQETHTHTQPCYHRFQEVSGRGGITSYFHVSYTFSIPLGIEEPEELHPGMKTSASPLHLLKLQLAARSTDRVKSLYILTASVILLQHQMIMSIIFRWSDLASFLRAEFPPKKIWFQQSQSTRTFNFHTVTLPVWEWRYAELWLVGYRLLAAVTAVPQW